MSPPAPSAPWAETSSARAAATASATATVTARDVVLMATAIVLFILDIKAPTHGVLTAGGIISFVFGAYMLFNTAEINVPWLTIISLALATAAFFAFAIGKALAAQRRQPSTGMEGMQGQVGEVRRELDPEGMVLVSGELWRAVSESGPLPVGEKVIVTGQEGFLLKVKKGS